MRKHKITHDEYRHATHILVATVKAGEESLLYDVFFEAEATDISNASSQGSVEAIEGPFYLPNAPRLEAPYVLPQRSDEAGDVLFFHGRVTSPDGTPLAGAELDMWQADAEGLYSNIHPNIPEWNLQSILQGFRYALIVSEEIRWPCKILEAPISSFSMHAPSTTASQNAAYCPFDWPGATRASREAQGERNDESPPHGCH